MTLDAETSATGSCLTQPLQSLPTHLRFTSADYSPFGSPRPRMPVLLDDQMRIAEHMNNWLFSIALRGLRPMRLETLRAYAESLLPFSAFLRERNWDYLALDTEHILEYRDWLIEGTFRRKSSSLAPRHDQYRKPATINLRMAAVRGFYNWLRANRFIEISPFDFASVLSDARESLRGLTSMRLKEEERHPEALAPEQIARLLLSLSVRDDLIARWALFTGMRRFELCALRLDQLEKPVQGDLVETPCIKVHLTETKGLVPRNVFPPTALVNQTWAYITWERQAIVDRTGSVDPHVFLNANGGPVSKQTITESIERACRVANIEATFHELRHTFATVLLVVV